MNSFPLVAARLDDLAIVEISGPDACAFLQGQLTQDISALDASRACLAGYCSPKGRLIASMIVWHASAFGPDTFHALVKQDIASEFANRLSKFIMRAKVAIRPYDAQIVGATIAATDAARKSLAETGMTAATADIPGLSTSQLPPQAKPYDIVRSGPDTWVAAPSANPDIQRWWLIASNAQQAGERGGVLGNDQNAAAWHAQDIAAGLGWVVAGIQEAFIPQTLNMDLTGGISFGKGCYPGQEIVARSHYRGTVKRRMAYGIIDSTSGGVAAASLAAGLPGTDVFDAGKPDSPCGRVINAAGVHRTHLLFEVRLADLGQADFRLHDANGPTIRTTSLPYKIQTD